MCIRVLNSCTDSIHAVQCCLGNSDGDRICAAHITIQGYSRSYSCILNGFTPVRIVYVFLQGAQRGARRQGQRMNGAPRPRNNDRDREAVKPERERKPRPSGNSDRHVDRGNARTTSHVENDYPTRGPTSNGTFQQHSHITSSAHLPAMAD